MDTAGTSTDSTQLEAGSKLEDSDVLRFSYMLCKFPSESFFSSNIAANLILGSCCCSSDIWC